MDIPRVVIVGRPNVGKSSLFNALCGSRVAIVESTPGVTRDRISRMVSHKGCMFELIDTGGLGLHDSEELAADIETQIIVAIEQAELVLAVVDAKVGLQPGDKEIVQALRAADKQMLLVVNKCDSDRDELVAAEFYELGLPELNMTAAVHRRGVRALLDEIVDHIPHVADDPEVLKASDEGGPMKIAFVGRRNVGKSTLVNFLAQEPRVIVSEIPGTTRDAVDVNFRVGDLEFIAIDTAGLHRRKQIKDNIDYYSSVRAESSIHRADVVVHVLEAPMEIGRMDKQLGAMVAEACKPCVLAMNKMDLAEGVTIEEFTNYVRDRMRGAHFMPIVYISAVTGEGVPQLVQTAQALHQQSFIRVPTSDINRVIQDAAVRRRPPSTPSRLGKIFYATQVGTKPPTIAVFCNEPKLIDNKNYLRYLSNQVRSAFGYNAIPIRFLVRGRSQAPAES